MASELPKEILNSDGGTGQSPAVPAEKILHRECVALTSCLKDAVVKTAQIYNFYADTHKLDIDKHVQSPPRSLTAALGRDIEKYDQLCDSIEAHLLRAISVLKRNLRKEEEKAAAEQRRKNAESLMPPPALPPSLEIAADTLSSRAPSEGSSTNPRNSPVLSTVAGRRPSAISISSLHRPQFPLKLDLSATSFRITEEEALHQKGLASPVTLAPKSARPVGSNEFDSDLMAAFAASTSVPLESTSGPTEIALTLPHEMHLQHNDSHLVSLDIGLGDSSDKPIELDLDAIDIEMANMANPFGPSSGESNNPHEGLFSPMLGAGAGEQSKDVGFKQEGDSLNIFNADSTATDELFGDFSPDGNIGHASEATILQPQSISSVPSPRSMLAQFAASSDLINIKTSPSENTRHEAAGGFDSFDLSNLDPQFFPTTQHMEFPMDMDDFLHSENVLNVDAELGHKGDNSES